MTFKSTIFALAATALALSISACQANGNAEHDHSHHPDESEHGPECDEHDHSDVHAHAEAESPDEIVLEPAMAEKFGVATVEVAPGEFNSIVSVSGQIVDSPNSASVVSAPTSGIVRFAPGVTQGAQARAGMTIATISSDNITGGNADAIAKANLDAAKKELDRVTPLHADGIVSTKDYNAAVQAYEQARAAYSSAAARGIATAPQSGVITSLLVQQGQYVAAGEPIASISSTKDLTLRADLPEKYYSMLPQLTSANIQPPYSDSWVDLSALKAKRVSAPSSVSSQRGYVPVFFTFANDGSLIPGSYVNVKLIGAPRTGVITVPLTAISEQQGAHFVYEQIDEECYRKIPVQLGANDGIDVEIASGLQGGEKIVSEGVVGVRLAETSTVAPEGHSHNH